MPALTDLPDVPPLADEAELLLAHLSRLREAILRKVEHLDEQQARWRPEGALLPLLGIVDHLTHSPRPCAATGNGRWPRPRPSGRCR